MTMCWTEGFEIHNSATYLTRKYAAGTGGSSTEAGRLFGTAQDLSTMLTTPSFGVQNVWIMGFGFKCATAISGTPKFVVLNGGTEQCHLELATSGAGFVWVLKRGTTTIATSPTVHSFDTWMYVELKVTVRTGTNGVYELRVDEISEMSGSSVNLANAGSDGADVFQFGSTSTSNAWDDIYICNDQGAQNKDFLGDSAVRGMLPNGDGASSAWTTSTGSTHYTLVDDPATTPNDADYVKTSNNGDRDLYDYENVASLIQGTIRGIMVTTDMKMETSGTSTDKVVIRQGGVNYDQATHTVNGTNVIGYTQVVELDPATSAAFTGSGLDSMQVGIERVS